MWDPDTALQVSFRRTKFSLWELLSASLNGLSLSRSWSTKQSSYPTERGGADQQYSSLSTRYSRPVMLSKTTLLTTRRDHGHPRKEGFGGTVIHSCEPCYKIDHELRGLVKARASCFQQVPARKALRALRGLVKLQALVRGQLVRRRANATLRRMQAMALEESRSPLNPISSISTHMRSGRSDGFRPTHHEINDGVEMDIGEAMLPTMEDRGGYSYVNHRQSRRAICRLSAWMSPRTCSGRFQDYNYDAICTATSSPQCYSVRPNIDIPRAPLWSPRPDYIEPVSNSPIPPNNMAETESSRAKARSHSAPKQRTVDDPEKQPGKRRRRRVSMEGGTDVLRTASRMQRSTSLLGSTATRNRQYPSSIRLDRSSASLGDSECGSTSSVLMDTNYFEWPVWYETHGNRHKRGLPPTSLRQVA